MRGTAAQVAITPFLTLRKGGVKIGSGIVKTENKIMREHSRELLDLSCSSACYQPFYSSYKLAQIK